MERIDVSLEYWDARFQGLPKSESHMRLRDVLSKLTTPARLCEIHEGSEKGTDHSTSDVLKVATLRFVHTQTSGQCTFPLRFLRQKHHLNRRPRIVIQCAIGPARLRIEVTPLL